MQNCGYSRTHGDDHEIQLMHYAGMGLPGSPNQKGETLAPSPAECLWSNPVGGLGRLRLLPGRGSITEFSS